MRYHADKSTSVSKAIVWLLFAVCNTSCPSRFAGFFQHPSDIDTDRSVISPNIRQRLRTVPISIREWTLIFCPHSPLLLSTMMVESSRNKDKRTLNHRGLLDPSLMPATKIQASVWNREPNRVRRFVLLSLRCETWQTTMMLGARADSLNIVLLKFNCGIAENSEHRTLKHCGVMKRPDQQSYKSCYPRVHGFHIPVFRAY